MAGIQNLAICAGGFTTGNVANTEIWNGSSWTEINDLSTARHAGGSSINTSTSMYVAGGYTTVNVTTTEEFTAPAAVSTVTTS
jgi:N-acetylneuraminic acid mutarotase